MSERSRHRRRRRRGGGASSGSERGVARETPQGQPVREQASGSGSGRRRRRGRGRSQERRVSSPKSSEDLVRALPRERPETLTAPPDGQTLEGLIGDLQSEYGVPQYPQEYRITVKVAEERDRGERAAPTDEAGAARPAPAPARDNGGPRREKAPSMRAAGGPEEEDAAGAQPAGARKRSRRRRRGRGRAGGQPRPPATP